MNKLIVKTNNKNYPIYVGNHILKDLRKILVNEKINFNKTLIVVDKKIKKKFIKQTLINLKNKENYVIKFKSTEINKNIGEVEKIINFL